MALARTIRMHRIEAIRSAMLVMLAGWLGLLLPLAGVLERLSFDVATALRPAQRPPEDVTLVYLDDYSHQQLGQPYAAPWDRRLHAHVLTNLVHWGVRAVVFDIVFDRPAPEAAADDQFAQALKFAQGKVVLAALFDDSQKVARPLLLPHVRLNEAAGRNWGVANFRPDRDGAIRRHFHQDREWKDAVSLAWRTVSLLGAESTLRADAAHAGWLNYYGPPGSLPHVSYWEAFQGTNRSLAAMFQNKVVFIGAGTVLGYSGAAQEGFRTPYSRFAAVSSPGVDIHATQFLNLWRGDGLTRISPWLEFALVGLLGALLGAGLAMVRPWTALGLGLAAALLLAAAACLIIWQVHLWMSWAVLSLVQAPAAALCAIVFRAHKATLPTRAGATAEFAPAQLPEEPSSLPRIPDHELLRRIGSGSYGDVWLARNVMGTFRAVKVVQRRRFGEDRQFEREFAGLRAFEPVSRLHEGLVDILHVGKDEVGSSFYYVMELADPVESEPSSRTQSDGGKSASTEFRADAYLPRTLQNELKHRGRLSFNECLQIGLALSAALEFLHQRGLVHRDVKPSNIVFVNSLPKLADIGLVTMMDTGGSFVGTAGYIPPEGPGYAAGDVFGLGKVLYEISSGLPRERFPEWPASGAWLRDAELEARWQGVVTRACEARVEARHASAQALHQDLIRLLGRGG